MTDNCPNHTTAKINDGERIATMHFCNGIEISRHDGEVVEQYKQSLINQTKTWGIIDNPDGTQNIKMKLSFEGSVNNAIVGEERFCQCGEPLEWQDAWGIKEAARLYKEGRDAWLRGDFKTVAELFGVLV